MSSKELLKKVKEHLASKEFSKAKDVCSRILMFDGSNYMGLVYLGLAQQNLGLSKESEATYKKAIELSPSQPIAYQGLISLFEKTDQVDMLPQAYVDARQVFMESGIASKVVELTNKLIDFYAQDPAYLDLRLKSMRSLLPGGEMYSFIEKSDVEQKPISLLTVMADLECARDQKLFVNEVESRRRRLSNDTMATIRQKVKTEIHQQSQYLSTLEMILASKDDLDKDACRKFNEAYLGYLLERLLYTFVENKPEVLRKLLNHSSNLISEGLAIDLAYEIHYGFQDVADSEYEMEMYAKAYPSSKLALLAQHVLTKKSEAFVMEDLDVSSIAIVAHHALAWHFMRLNQTDLALSHAKSLDAVTKDFAEALPRVKQSCRLVFAFCYLKSDPSLQNVAYNTFQSILETDPNNLMALEGVSMYAIAKGRLDLALSSTSAALAINPSQPTMLLSLGWIYILSGKPVEAVTPIQKALELSPRSAVGLFRLGRAYWDMGGAFKEDKSYAYAYFLKAAQMDAMFGDPFLFLGHFYHEVAGDKARALKCYLKATQLKQGIEAYKSLYTQQLLANDIKGAQNSVSLATQEFPTLAWSWGKMGLFHLTNSRWTEAITCFQGALKADFNCVEYWEGLGEAYLEAGRLMAALKAFQRAEKLAPQSCAIAYYTAKVHLLLGNHLVASSGLEAALQTLAPNSFYLLPCTKLLAEIFYCHSQVAHRSGAFGLMAMLAQKSLNALEKLLTLDSNVYSGWELLGDVALLARLAPAQFGQLDVASISHVLANKAKGLEKPQLLASIHDLGDGCTALLQVASLSYQVVIHGLSSNELVGHFLYKAAFAMHAIHSHIDSESHRDQGLAYICSALNCDPTNPLFWELLGIMTLSTKPAVSQHAFCQSLKLDSRNPSPYANYGYLCLLQSDFELAATSFSKAQSISPEFAPSWIGQVAIAQITAAPNTSEIITHAFSLNESISKGLNLAYASCLLKDSLPTPLPQQQLHSGIFALQKFIELVPAHAQALNLLATYYEQAGSLEAASNALAVAKDSLVAEHMANQEPSLLPAVFSQFVRVMINLGRVLTAMKKFNEAGAAYQAAKGCVDQLGGAISERDAVHLQLGLGIANFYHNDLQSALESFERALALGTDYPELHHQVTLQVSQVLWAMGGSDQQEAAKEQLMGCVRNQTHTVGVLLALLVMGLIQGDNDLASAVIGELDEVLPHTQSKEDPEMLMQYVLSQLEALQKDYSGAIGMLTSTLLKYPYLAEPYLALAQLLLQLRDSFAPSVKMVRQIAASGLAITDPSGSLPAHTASSAELVSQLHMSQASASHLMGKKGDPSLDIQRAIFAAPWLYSLP
ncbi:Superkiller protein 3 [Entomophthora muscae]|uniref:Superkiller protein 3 n=1 Tax=Entomophthora muscae TaxID=34485 RepID=A0ACC2UQJ4_9FUNG|nr:Superkiller protein 3 [Entomophthora muscae]